MTFREACESPLFSHARSKPWCRAWIIYVYHRAPESPTGVLLAASAEDTPANEAILRAAQGTSPLSPTEPR